MAHEHHHHGHHTKMHGDLSVNPNSKVSEHSMMGMPGRDHGPTDHSAHDKHAGHHTHDFLRRFWICLILTIPVLVLSPMVQQWFGFKINFTGDKYVLLGISALIYFYGGWPFIAGMVSEIRDKAIGMMTLVALAITVAFVYSIATVFGLDGMDFFWELATLIDIMLVGHWLEMKSQMAASKALESLVSLLPSIVHRERNGTVEEIGLKELQNNDIILIKPGEKIPADGVVLEGNSYINESMLTGESVPVKKEKGAKVIAGSINVDGSLKVDVTGAGKDSYLNKVIALVRSAQSAKSNTQNLADKVAKWLTITSILVGVATFLYWYSIEADLAFALERLVTVMVTSCPHALGVAIPLVVAISTTKAAVSGLLIRNRTAFENARNLTTIIFDKTGTLTRGSHEVQNIIPVSAKYTEDDILRFAAAAEQNSEHYLARGIIKKLREKNLPLLKSENFNYQQGIGVHAKVDGNKVMVVGSNFFRLENKPVPPIPGKVDQDTETISFVFINDKLESIITLADTVRETAREAVGQLKEMGIRSFLLTGDNEKIAESVSNQLVMDGYLANVLPHQKQEKVKEFQEKGELVAMTGDGVNDAPALAQADVGIAIGSGTDVAAETADIILVNSDPNDVVKVISFARATYRKMVENLFWAVGYNVIAIPLAAGILYPKFVLSPALGAVLMSLSTVIVALNAQLLRRRFKHQPVKR